MPPQQLTWWEYDELTEHLNDRPDIWTCDPETNPWLWMRMDRPYSEFDTVQQEPAAGFQFLPPKDPESPYRQFSVMVVPMSWDGEACDDYLTKLLFGWTSYGQRLERTELLMKCGVAADTAPLIALALGVQDHSDREAEMPTGKDVEPLPDSLAPLMPAPPDPLHIGTYLHAGGGYTSLRFAGGQMRVKISVPSANKRGLLAFGPPLEGFVRPIDGRIRDTAVFLSGRAVVEPDVHPLRGEQVRLW